VNKAFLYHIVEKNIKYTKTKLAARNVKKLVEEVQHAPVQSGKQINKKHFQNNSNEIDL